METNVNKTADGFKNFFYPINKETHRRMCIRLTAFQVSTISFMEL